MVDELWLDKVNDPDELDNIDTYLSDLRTYLFQPGFFSKRKDEVCSVHQGKHSSDFKLGQMLISAYFLRILYNSNIKIQLEYFFNSSESKDLNKYINYISRIYEEKCNDYATLKCGISKSIVDLSDDMANAVAIHGSTVNLYELGRLAKEDEHFNELLHFTIPDGLQLNDIENMVTDKVNETIDYLSNHPSVYQELIRGKAVNARQLGQSIVNIGLKPDLDGQVIPDPINTSFIRGLRGRQDLYACATGARKSLLINYSQVKQSGYLTKQLSLLCLDSMISEEEYCDTKFTMPLEVKNKDTFERIIGRVLDNGHVITEADEENIVGKEIEIYSPITCNCKTGICKRCYGKLATKNKGYHAGMTAVLLLTNPLTQMLLSSKHLLMAKTEKVEWGEAFEEVFQVDRDCIYPSLETSNVSFEASDVSEDDEGDLYIRKIRANNKGRIVEVISPKKLFLMEEQVKKYANEAQTIKFEAEQSIPCFKIKTRNIELNAGLASLIDLLSKSDHDGLGNDICAIYNSFINRLNENKIKMMAVHAEVILSNLIFEGDTSFKPDFSDAEKDHDIQVKSVSQSIINKPVLSTALSFEQLKKQLNSTKTYYKRSVGIFDRLFV